MAHRILDLTQSFTPGMFTWPGDPVFSIDAVPDSGGFHINTLRFSDHGGTHIGTAAHFDPTGADVARLRPEQLIVPGICLDVHEHCEKNPEYLLQIDDILAWENQFGVIPSHHVVLIATGWDRFWRSPQQYFGEQNQPTFPGIASETMGWLVQNRRVTGVGIDTAGIDGSAGRQLAANRILLKENRYHLENLAHLTKLPPRAFKLYIGALPIPGATGSPCRVLAHWED